LDELPESEPRMLRDRDTAACDRRTNLLCASGSPSKLILDSSALTNQGQKSATINEFEGAGESVDLSEMLRRSLEKKRV